MTIAQTLTERIADISQALEGRALLRPASHPEGEGWHVISNFALAQEYAYHRYISDAEDADNWSDLRKREVSELLRPTYADPRGAEVRTAVRALPEPFTAKLAEGLPAPYQSAIDDVATDLENIALSRMVPDAGSGLFPKLWEAYRQGVWPCGWEGVYPAGRLVVFQPPLE
jgi:hypothetical protein